MHVCDTRVHHTHACMPHTRLSLYVMHTHVCWRQQHDAGVAWCWSIHTNMREHARVERAPSCTCLTSSLSSISAPPSSQFLSLLSLSSTFLSSLSSPLFQLLPSLLCLCVPARWRRERPYPSSASCLHSPMPLTAAAPPFVCAYITCAPYLMLTILSNIQEISRFTRPLCSTPSQSSSSSLLCLLSPLPPRALLSSFLLHSPPLSSRRPPLLLPTTGLEAGRRGAAEACHHCTRGYRLLS
jgi:hypothetical protein